MTSYLYRYSQASVARHGQDVVFLSWKTYSALRHGHNCSRCAIHDVLFEEEYTLNTQFRQSRKGMFKHFWCRQDSQLSED